MFIENYALYILQDEYFVALPKKILTPRHEKFLRKFQYKEALSSALKVRNVDLLVANDL